MPHVSRSVQAAGLARCSPSVGICTCVSQTMPHTASYRDVNKFGCEVAVSITRLQIRGYVLDKGRKEWYRLVKYLIPVVG